MKTRVNSRNKKSKIIPVEKGGFNAQAFLDTAGVSRSVKEFKKGEVIYSQGDAAKNVM